MKKIIIVTGGSGFIGSNLIEKLLDKSNYKIISIDNYTTGSTKNHVNSSRVKYIHDDIRNIYKICKNIKHRIIAIFHFGEFARIHQSFKNVKECFNTNISGSQKIINFCLENKIKLIYSATSASLGNDGSDGNLSPYAFSKSKNLELIINLNKWFGLKYEILYFYNVYGPKQICKGEMATVIGIFEEQFKNKKPLTVVKPGSQSRKFTHINDTVNGCFVAWKLNKNREYILSNNTSYSIKNVALMFSKKIKYTKPRLGERFKSSTVKKIKGRKIYRIPCKLSLKKYVDKFKLGV